VAKLDAKWLLEHQLAQNRARRAREAAEDEVVSNNRKLEAITDGDSRENEVQHMEDNPAKRIKTQHSPGDTALLAIQSHEDSKEDLQAMESAHKSNESISDAVKRGSLTAKETGPRSANPGDKDPIQIAEVQDKKSSEVVERPRSKPQAASPEEEVKEESEQVDQMVNDEDMNFESMFGDANAGNDQSNDLAFDLDLNPDNIVGSNPFESTTSDVNNLELLPGLESYANASGDDFGMLNLPPSTTANQPSRPTQENNFELPEIQGDSNFNDLFADGDFGGDASLMDLDLEDGFFNT
jgi:hypothetical protein